MTSPPYNKFYFAKIYQYDMFHIPCFYFILFCLLAILKLFSYSFGIELALVTLWLSQTKLGFRWWFSGAESCPKRLMLLNLLKSKHVWWYTNWQREQQLWWKLTQNKINPNSVMPMFWHPGNSHSISLCCFLFLTCFNQAKLPD